MRTQMERDIQMRMRVRMEMTERREQAKAIQRMRTGRTRTGGRKGLTEDEGVIVQVNLPELFFCMLPFIMRVCRIH